MTNVRRAGTASAAALSGIILALGLAHAAAPQWTQRIGLDVWNLIGLQDELRSYDCERERLQNYHEHLNQEFETLDHIANRLATGTLPLAEAADTAEPPMRERAGSEATAERNYPAPTFRHSVARFLIARLGRTMADDPSRWATVSARLEAEYATLK